MRGRPPLDTAGHDGDACKGVAYAGVRQWSTAPVTHTFVTHTQADTNVVEENRTAREEQLRKAAAFVDVCAGGAPFGEEVIVMGDLALDHAEARAAALVGDADQEVGGAQRGRQLLRQLDELREGLPRQEEAQELRQPRLGQLFERGVVDRHGGQS